MQFDESYVNVKWFGAKGDWVSSGSGTVDNVPIQNALSFASAADNNLNIYFPKGKYRIIAPQTGNDALIMNCSGNNYSERVEIYGAGPNESALVYDDPNSIPANVLKVISLTNRLICISAFEIRGVDESTYIGTGMTLQSTYPLKVKNMMFRGLYEGIRLDMVNNSIIEHVYLRRIKYGIIAQTQGVGTAPNVLHFSSCQFIENHITAIQLIDFTSASFQSCDISYNGSDNTPALSVVAGIDCTFNGQTGANDLNVKDCYIEGNIGLADIRVEVHTGGANNPYYGTHTFIGNTFNRNENKDLDTNNPIYTNHNILITGAGQNPQLLFGRSKCRLVFEGNGFFVNRPGDPNNYVPDAIRKAIQIDYYSSEYWEFDILEQGNVYAGAAYGDAPVFDPNSPQVSEYTRVKAFGKIEYFDETLDPPAPPVTILSDCYNVLYFNQITTGTYEIFLANGLDHEVSPVATCLAHRGQHPNIVFAYVNAISSNRFTVSVYNLAGQLVNHSFSFVVY